MKVNLRCTRRAKISDEFSVDASSSRENSPYDSEESSDDEAQGTGYGRNPANHVCQRPKDHNRLLFFVQ